MIDNRDENRRRLKTRNWALFMVLIIFAAVIYVVTMIKLGYGPQ